MNSFYTPSIEQLTKLSENWCCAYSGGKDSTCMVTWIEYLRRANWITVKNPMLVMSDTTVEDRSLEQVTLNMMSILENTGWKCTTVKPRIHEKLYNRILGIGVQPIHPGVRNMRWCTRSTKIDPMNRHKKSVFSSLLTLTGLRLGESAIRDGKILRKKSCSSGGECGTPEPSADTYSPLLNWSTCQVVDWLNAGVESQVRDLLYDVFNVTKQLASVYGINIQEGFDNYDESIKVARFGCIGCPAISANPYPPKATIRRHGINSPLNEIYQVWFDARKPENRLYDPKKCKKVFGPIKLSYRPVMFDRIIDIQKRANVILLTKDDQEFIKDCWANRIYPRGWSYEDESGEKKRREDRHEARIAELKKKYHFTFIDD